MGTGMIKLQLIKDDEKMMDYLKMIKKLEEENERFDTTEWQREANIWRIKYLKLVNRPKSPETSYIRLDPVSERLKDENYSCAPGAILRGRGFPLI
jgi:hypothetical protein